MDKLAFKSEHMATVANKNEHLISLGFAFPLGSPHVSRTMMLSELTTLLDVVPADSAIKDEYAKAIIHDNCLAKRTERNRIITLRYLSELYSLDPKKIVFRALKYFWKREPAGRPLLALLCAYSRDSLLRASAAYFLPLPIATPVSREETENFLENLAPGRYSPGKRASNAKNLNSTWTQSGHLAGRSNKMRTRANPTAGSVAYALLLGYLTGGRGRALFQTEYMHLLDCSQDSAIILAEEASRKGWIVFKRVGNVMEALFPGLINKEEMESLYEQN